MTQKKMRQRRKGAIAAAPKIQKPPTPQVVAATKDVKQHLVQQRAPATTAHETVTTKAPATEAE
jgi:hypothetical protein